jgi:hypothetical protein
MNLIEYFIATVIVILFLIGAVLLSLRLRTRKERNRQLKEIDDHLPTGGFPRALKGERTISLDDA